MAKLLLLLSLWSSIREVSQLPGLNSKYSPSFSTFNNPQYSIFILRLTFARFLIKSTKGLHGESIWKPDVEQISFVELNFQLFWRFWEWLFGQPTKMYSLKKPCNICPKMSWFSILITKICLLPVKNSSIGGLATRSTTWWCQFQLIFTWLTIEGQCSSIVWTRHRINDFA